VSSKPGAGQFEIREAELVLYGYSWGAVIAAQSVTSGKVRPDLTVLASPIERLVVPPLTRFLIPFVPTTLFSALRPLVELWIIHFKSRGAGEAAPALRVLRSAHLDNWKAVSRSNVSKSFLSAHSRVRGSVLLIFELADRFHDVSEYRVQKLLVEMCEVPHTLAWGNRASTRMLAARWGATSS
jgi:alpha-beta hydrolase superfamily lysophospholipase